MLLSALLLTPALAVPDDSFTVVALPDTQYYACGCYGGSPDTFTAQTAWIVDELAKRDVRFVTQLGDCVENGDNAPEEWAVADAAFSMLEDPETTGRAEGVPYGVAVGNHDQTPFGDASGSTALYNATFGVARFAERSWYGDHHGDDNDNHYEFFSGGGTDFLVLHLEYDPAVDPEVLVWAAGVLTAHNERLAIVVSHHLIDTAGTWGDQGLAIYEALKDRPNLLLMLSGHVAGTGRRSDTWGDRTVHTLLSDYQGLANGGDGWLRLMRFSKTAGTLSVQTWSPTLGAFDSSDENAFTLTVDLDWPLGGTDTDTRPDSGTDSATETVTELPQDSGTAPVDPIDDTVSPPCGCSTGVGAGWWGLAGLLALTRRRDSPISVTEPDGQA